MENLGLETEVVRKFQEGHTYEQLAEEYGVSRGTIWRIIKRHNALKYQELRVLRAEKEKQRLRVEVLSELTDRLEVMDVLDYLDLLPDESVQLVVTSPPYNLGKEYEARRHLIYYRGWMEQVLAEFYRVLKPEGALFLNLGNFVEDGAIVPLDTVFVSILRELEFQIRNRIVWIFRHGLHCRNRFSHRHESIIFATKTDDYYFNLDAVRIPQQYPFKRGYKGANKGKFTCNPLGKNPGDVWDITPVKAGHGEKFTGSKGVVHPCQFPTEIPRRAILACTRPGDYVLDPFMGSGTTAVVCQELERKFLGCDINTDYIQLAYERLEQMRGKLVRLAGQRKLEECLGGSS